MKKRIIALIIFGCVLLSACSNEETVKKSVENQNQESTEKKIEEVSTNASKTEVIEEETKIPSDNEVKEIIEKSYKLIELAKIHTEENQKHNFSPFLISLKPYFTESFINKLDISYFAIPTGGNFPIDFDYDKLFNITERNKNKLTVEVSQYGYDQLPLTYTINAKMENDDWKIDNFTYKEESADKGEKESTTGLDYSIDEILSEEYVEQIVTTYLNDYEDMFIETITLQDEDTYYVEAYVKMAEDHMNPIFLNINSHTGYITKLN